MDKSHLMELFRSIFREDNKIIENIENKYDLVAYFKDTDENENKIIGMFYAEIRDNIDLLEYLINNFDYTSEYEECVLNYSRGLYYASVENMEYEKSGLYFLKALEYVETHNQKIIISNENYGRNFKAMVLFYVGYYYFKINKSYKAKEYVTKAKEIFKYKTKNIKKSITCNVLLSSICLHRGNTFEARKYFRQIERTDIEIGSLSYDINNNLLYLYFIEENYEECSKRIIIGMKEIEKYTDINKYYFHMYAGLVNFTICDYNKAKEHIEKSLVLINNIDKYKDEEKEIYKRMLTIVTNTNPTIDDIVYLKKVFIPYIVEKDVYSEVVIVSRYIDEWAN